MNTADGAEAEAEMNTADGPVADFPEVVTVPVALVDEFFFFVHIS